MRQSYLAGGHARLTMRRGEGEIEFLHGVNYESTLSEGKYFMQCPPCRGVDRGERAGVRRA